MTDEELMTMVREQRSSVPMTTPVDQIISRGRTVRTRRRIPGVAGALAGAAAVALAVAALLPAGHQANRLPPFQLAAWTVTRQPDGTVYVTIRELRDAAGLQGKLRADGVPASVTFGGEPNPSCKEYPGRWDLEKAGIQELSGGPYIFAIHPSALPRGAGVQLTGKTGFAYRIPGHLTKPPVPGAGAVRVPMTVVGAGLVQISQSCTGLPNRLGG